MTPVHASCALKEWACVVRALREGRQAMLLRKGGIHEPHGELEAAHREFLLVPGLEHQKAELLKPADAEKYAPLLGQPGAGSHANVVTLDTFARLEAAIPLDDPRKAYRLGGEHIWTDEYVRMRVEYKPERPLFVFVLRVYRLESHVMVPWTERHAGCRSWVELDAAVEIRTGAPALDDEAFREAADRILRRLEGIDAAG